MRVCKKCGLDIGFVLKDGRWHPTDKNGSPHWMSCKATRKPESRESKTQVGRHYFPMTCECHIPPWEVCDECPNKGRIRIWKEADDTATSEGRP